jgi:hypothetical protein
MAKKNDMAKKNERKDYLVIDANGTKVGPFTLEDAELFVALNTGKIVSAYVATVGGFVRR